MDTFCEGERVVVRLGRQTRHETVEEVVAGTVSVTIGCHHACFHQITGEFLRWSDGADLSVDPPEQIIHLDAFEAQNKHDRALSRVDQCLHSVRLRETPTDVLNQIAEMLEPYRA